MLLAIDISSLPATKAFGNLLMMGWRRPRLEDMQKDVSHSSHPGLLITST